MVRRRIVFTGSVQGVGFRWRARQAAALYGCTGWCRNEYDGSVLMEIQGEEADIRLVLDAVREGRYVWITHMAVTDVPVVEREYGFGTD